MRLVLLTPRLNYSGAKCCLIPFGWKLGGRQRRLFSQRLFISLFGSRRQRDYYMNFIVLVIPLPSCKLLFLKVEKFSRNDNDFYCILLVVSALVACHVQDVEMFSLTVQILRCILFFLQPSYVATSESS